MTLRPFVTAMLVGCSAVAVAAARTDAAEPQQAQIRFEGMDRNGDGRITRAEWRGNDQSFRTHDWNGDGILSGDEIRTGGSRGWNDDDQTRRQEFRNWTERGFTNLDRNRDGRIQRTEWFYDRQGFIGADRNGDGILTRAEFLREADLFSDLDANNDRVITPDEWRGPQRTFARQDTNGDGQLSRRELTDAELQNLNLGNPRGPIGTSGRAIVVEAARGWVDSGIDVQRGDRLSIDANGTVTLSSNGSDLAEPGGSRTGRRANSAPLRNDPAGALIGRINNGAPMLIGNQRTLVVSESGRLFLSVNDDYMNDNSGEYRVNVLVNR